MSLLSSCGTKTVLCNAKPSKYVLEELPFLPYAGASVGDDIDRACIKANVKCENLTRWFNEMIKFAKNYKNFFKNQEISR